MGAALIYLKKICNNNKVFLASIFLYILITLPALLNHVPWHDEAHAYMQSYYMNWSNWIDILKAEGHPSLWFLMIMPFAKFQWHYPYPMQIINYISCLAAIFVLWKKSKFNFLLKIAITFSSMFLIYFPIIARGYTTAVLFLFLLSALYKNKLNYPILYPTLVFMTLNLNIVCGIGASWFGLVFFIEMLKSNALVKTKIMSSLILVLAVIIFIFPFIGGFGNNTVIADSNIGFGNLIFFFCIPYYIRVILYLSALVTLLIKTHICWEQTFILYTHGFLLCLFGIFYPGYPHHFIFFYIYLILFLWIYIDKYSEKENLCCSHKKVDLLSILMVVILLFPLQNRMSYLESGNEILAKELVKQLNTQPQFRDSDIYLSEKYALLIPYLKNDIHVYNTCNLKPAGWDAYFTHECVKYLMYNSSRRSYLFSGEKIHGMKYYTWKQIYIYEL